MLIEYVCGFMFDGDRVLLIRKNRPDWQAGKLNGIGGKVEDGEDMNIAMVREFYEETGITTKPEAWKEVATLSKIDRLGNDDGWIVYFVAMKGDIHIATTMTDEALVIYPHTLVSFHYSELIPDLKWIIPMALLRVNSTETSVYRIYGR